MASWRDDPHAVCPVCKRGDVATVERVFGPTANLRERREHYPVHCRACGYCTHEGQSDPFVCVRCGRAVEHRSGWWVAEHLPRPAGMGDEEFGLRCGLFERWRQGPASVYVQALEQFADFLADQGSPEEAAARAGWEARDNSAKDPSGWHRWLARMPHGWAIGSKGGTPSAWGLLVSRRAGLLPQQHNATYFLGWPPGYVKVTGAEVRGGTYRWRVTVEKGRSLAYSRPVEHTHADGYAALFRPPAGADTSGATGLFAGATG